MNGDIPSWIFFMAAAGALGMVLAARSLLASRREFPGSETYVGRRFADEKRVLVSGWSAEELSQIVQQFQGLYAADIPTSDSLKAKWLGADTHEIRLPDACAEHVFAFLVNYVHYPHDFDVDTRNISVVGISKIADVAEKYGQGPAYVYVPRDDQEFDLVYVKIESGEIYKESFRNHRWKRVDDDRMPAGVSQLVSASTAPD